MCFCIELYFIVLLPKLKSTLELIFSNSKRKKNPHFKKDLLINITSSLFLFDLCSKIVLDL